MSLYIEDRGSFRPWDPTVPIKGIRYQPNIGELWTADELAKLKLYAPAEPEIPAGKVVARTRVERVQGVVSLVYDLEDAPGSVDERLSPLEPWQFWAIVELSGMGETALRSAIDLIDDPAFKATARAKLTNPPGGKFRRSDPLFSNAFLMMQLQKTEEEIDAMWRAALALT